MILPIVKYTYFMRELATETDNSKVVLGALLTQEYKVVGKKYYLSVSHASRSLKEAQRQYSVTDLKALAVVWAVKTFRFMLWIHVLRL